MGRKDGREKNVQKTARYLMLDEGRGLVFLSMFFYHAMWDLVYLFGVDAGWYRGTAGYVWQQSICWSFILLSGFCWPFGREKYRRGLLVFGAGALVTAVTCLFLPQDRVIFGVLTFLGTASLLTTFFHPLLLRMRAVPGFLTAVLLFVLTRNVNRGCLGFEGWRWIPLPDGWYRNLFSAFFGFPAKDFYSTDYFSLFPWLFLYLTGYFLHRCLTEGGCPDKKARLAGDRADRPVTERTDSCQPQTTAALPHFLKHGHVPALWWIGRHSLLCYLLHQPVLFLFLSAVHFLF